MQTLCSRTENRDQREMVVFIGCTRMVHENVYQDILAMDPEITPPVLVIPFTAPGINNPDNDNAIARSVISQITPKFIAEDLLYKTTRIRNYLLVKVLSG
jgi:hypothetical protein